VIWLNSNSTIYGLFTDGRRLVTGSSNLLYTLDPNDPTTLLLRVASLPISVLLNLPAQNVISATSGYPLQTPNVTVTLPDFVVYEYSAIYQGYTAQQFG
jgi:hypothetical protein